MGLSRRAVLAGAGTMFVAGCTGPVLENEGTGAPLGSEPAIDDAELLLNWKPNGLHVPYYAAKARGYYEAAGIPDPTILPGQGSDFSAKQAGLENVPLAVTSADQLLAVRSKGLALRSVGVLMQQSPVVVFAAREPFGGELRRAEQLEGKTIGTGPGMVRILTELLLERTGVRSEVEVVDTGYDTVQQVLSGEIDAGGGVFGDAIVARGRGYEIDSIRVAETIPSYGHVIVSGAGFAARHPTAVSRFLRATARGAAWATRNPEAATDHLIEAVGSLAESRDQQRKTWSVLAREYVLSSAVRDRGWGWSRPTPWRTMASALDDAGLLDGSVDPDQAWTNDYLDTESESIGSYASKAGVGDGSRAGE